MFHLPKDFFTFPYTGSFGLERIPGYPGDKYYEESGNLRGGIGNRLELSAVAYTRKDFTLGFTYLFSKPEEKRDWAFAWVSTISPKGSGLERVWFDDYSYKKTAGLKPAENFSIFCVGTKPVTDFLRFHIGLGRGRFVGYGDGTKYLNTDIFFDEKHQWAFGLFGALEFHIQEFLRVGLEADGRDINFGLRGNLGQSRCQHLFPKSKPPSGAVITSASLSVSLIIFLLHGQDQSPAKNTRCRKAGRGIKKGARGT